MGTPARRRPEDGQVTQDDPPTYEGKTAAAGPALPPSTLGLPATEEVMATLTAEQRQWLTDTAVPPSETWKPYGKGVILDILRRYHADTPNDTKPALISRLTALGFNAYGLIPRRLPVNPTIDHIGQSDAALAIKSGATAAAKRRRKSLHPPAAAAAAAAATNPIAVDDDDKEDGSHCHNDADDDRNTKREQKALRAQQLQLQQQIQQQRRDMTAIKELLSKLATNSGTSQTNTFNNAAIGCGVNGATAPSGFVVLNAGNSQPGGYTRPPQPPAPVVAPAAAAAPAGAAPQPGPSSAAGAGELAPTNVLTQLARAFMAMANNDGQQHDHQNPLGIATTTNINPQSVFRTFPIPGAAEVTRTAALQLVVPTGTGPNCDLSHFLPPPTAMDATALANNSVETFQFARDNTSGGLAIQPHRKTRPITTFAQWCVAWHRVMMVLRQLPIRGDAMWETADAHRYNVELTAMTYGEAVALAYDRRIRAAHQDSTWPQTMAIRNTTVIADEVLAARLSGTIPVQHSNTNRRATSKQPPQPQRSMHGTTVQANWGAAPQQQPQLPAKFTNKCRNFNTKRSCKMPPGECAKKWPHQCWWCEGAHAGDDCPSRISRPQPQPIA